MTTRPLPIARPVTAPRVTARALGSTLLTWLPWLLLAGLSLPVFRPFYREGLPRSFDGGLHLLRLGLLDETLRAGAIYPRWAPDALLGFGYPLFGYYAPGSYYLAELLHLLGLSFYAAFVTAFGLLMLAAAAGMARLAWDLFEGQSWPTALAALAYLYAPYLVTNTYIRGALAEVAAQALLPWILWCARRLVYSPQPRRAALPLAFSLAALAITHNITLLFTPPLLLGYLAVLWFSAGRPRPSLSAALLALLLAMGLSAFFWLPLLFERTFVANTGFEIARTVWLPASAWTRANFLDGGWTYDHTFARPIRLGLVQAALVAAGAIGARRRDAEWLFWIIVALISGGLMTAWALPLWQASDLLTLAQFTWRLLSVHSLALALLTGGLLAGWRHRLLLPLAGGLLMLLVVFSARPRLAWIDVFAPESVDVSLPVMAQTEVEKGVLGGGEGNSSIQEFRPRWAPATLTASTLDPITASPEIQIEQAGPFALRAAVTAGAAAPLRLASFYFPGWRAWLDGVPLALYPSGDLGLLTLDLPAGRHRIEVRWQGTPLQATAGALSIAALCAALGLAVVERQKGFGLLAGAGLLLAGSAYLTAPATPPVTPPPAAVRDAGLHLLGYRATQHGDSLRLHPYWLVETTQSSDLKVRWQLQTANGDLIAETITRPHYNALPASVWPPGTLVDDAYALPLPAGLPAGDYQLRLAVPAGAEPVLLGPVSLAATPATSTPPLTALDVRFGDQARLAGYRLETYTGQENAALPVLRPGDYLRVHLGWQADQPLDANLHGFVHLVSPGGTPLAQEDQLPGPFFQPPTLWTSARLAPDVYLLRLPTAARGGIYYPRVGLYDFADLDRLPVTTPGAPTPQDSYALPPVKIVAPPPAEPAQPLDYRLGDLATLTGYTPALRPIAAGSAISLMLQYRVLQPGSQNLTRFVQLLDPANQVIAQQDSLPAQGDNPTWAWVTGETVVDPVTLTLPPDTPPGRYRLVAGLYDAAGGARLPVYTAGGAAVPEQWAILGDVEITASP
ncbi:MAG: hypothetical protein IT329_04995 [Caldilineaceae bacterium]|nr:hypothetical protein [Caldilineaceae bacterium]